jgi:hypothetical protein
MPATEVKPSFPTFFDRDGSPLENGYIFIGIENQNPEVRTSRQQAYWDIGLTIPAAQPIRTIGGYASRNGSPGQLFTDDKHSLTVRDKNMRLIYTSATNLPLTGDLTGNVTGNLTGNVTGNVTGNLVGGTASLTTPLPIASGGTGANTAAGARTALGFDGAFQAAAAGVLLGPFSTASGASVTGTGVPSWATQVDVLFSGVVRATGGDVFLRLGTSASVEDTGYNSGSTYQDLSTTFFRSSGIAMIITQNETVFPLSGIVSLIKGASNTWNCSISLTAVGTQRTVIGAGVKSLSGTLDRVQVTTITASGFNGGEFYLRCR